MKTYKALAVLLSYPEPGWLAALDEIARSIESEADLNGGTAALAPLLELLRSEPLIALQENYVLTFDRNPSHSLHLFEHVHGESRERGAAMVNLLEEYRTHGFDVVADELPDYVPLFLEFLSLLPAETASALLGEAIHVLAHIGERLASNGSAYASVFTMLKALSPTLPHAIQTATPRAMEEVLETFGPLPDGSEPLLTPQSEIVRVAVPRPPRRNAAAGEILN